MIPRREMMMLGFTAVTAVAAITRIAATASLELGTVPSSYALSRARPVVSDDSLEEAAASTVANDPFRLVNRPSDVRFDARQEGGGVGAPLAPPPIRPTMTVRAIIGGPPWQAIIDGIPGQPSGTIVRGGSSFDKIVVRAVGRDTVAIQAPDTTWKLTIARQNP